MISKFKIMGKLPGLNEIVREARIHKFAGARQKKTITHECAYWIMLQNVPGFKKPVNISIKWVEKDKRRDVDNIQSGQKFILDALVMRGVIKDDSRKHVCCVMHDTSEISKLNPHIEVTISDEI